MKIVSCFIACEVSYYVIRCECGGEFSHRADRSKVSCGKCQKREDFIDIRERHFKSCERA